MLLRAAEEYAGRQELWPLQGRVRRLLDRLGEEPRRVHERGAGGADRLGAPGRPAGRRRAHEPRRSPSELAVTVKAVEWHLSHVYRKLGIPSRARLAATLGASA